MDNLVFSCVIVDWVTLVHFTVILFSVSTVYRTVSVYGRGSRKFDTWIAQTFFVEIPRVNEFRIKYRNSSLISNLLVVL